jgi:hypothetical protein
MDIEEWKHGGRDMRRGHGAINLEMWTWRRGHGGMCMEAWAWRHGHEAMDLEEWVWRQERGDMDMDMDMDMSRLVSYHTVQ